MKAGFGSAGEKEAVDQEVSLVSVNRGTHEIHEDVVERDWGRRVHVDASARHRGSATALRV